MTTTILLEGKVHPMETGATVVISQPTEHFVLWLRPTTKERPGAPYTVAPPDPFVPWTVQRIYCSPSLGAVADGLSHEVRDQSIALRQHASVDGIVYATVIWGATPSDLLIIVWMPAHSMVEGAVSSNQPGSVYEKAETYLPGFMAASGIRLRAKAHLLTKVNPMDSLSELEKQVDLLSGLVVTLMERVVPVGERPAWWADFKTLIETYDSTAAKGVPTALADITTQKQKVRDLIIAYYQERIAAGEAL